jgi:AcrR family transcriptional regulator
MKKKRSYRMRKRALSREETRLRIVEATMQLHQELGPRATTISAIAERAGVQRLTVYRHFPDEAAVFRACTSHWLDLNPPPDAQSWESLADPWQRLRAALSAFYDYYAATADMWTASYRDVDAVEALQEPMAEFAAHVERIADDLARPLRRGRKKTEPVTVTVRHALAFPTWKDLRTRGLKNPQMIDLVIGWLSGTAQKPAG